MITNILIILLNFTFKDSTSIFYYCNLNLVYLNSFFMVVMRIYLSKFIFIINILCL